MSVGRRQWGEKGEGEQDKNVGKIQGSEGVWWGVIVVGRLYGYSGIVIKGGKTIGRGVAIGRLPVLE